ncbi:MAG: hypothetical protein ABSC94_17175 [Polyangiaceae bacterium]
MTDAIEQLEQLLKDEREAIRRLDGATVLAFARRKQELMLQLQGRDGKLDARVASRLRALVPALRKNSVLLAHARDILRDALSAVGIAPPRASKLGGANHAARRLLSVRG